MIKQFGHTWWGKQWLNALSDIDFSNRLPRGKTYARNGQARNIIMMGNTVNAQVQGSRPKPYKVTLSLDEFSKLDKQQVIASITGNPLFLSQLLAREIPPDLHEELQRKYIELFPRSWEDMEASCSCPDCSGVLVRMKEGGVPTFRCHTGHAYSLDTLMAASTEHTEELLWNALRAIEETVLLLRHSAAHARDRGDRRTADAAERNAVASLERVGTLRVVLEQHRALAHESLETLWRRWADDVSGRAVTGGHFFPEEQPAMTARLLIEFFR